MRRLIIILLLCTALILQNSIVFASYTSETDELLSEQTYLSAIGAQELWNKLSEKGIIPGEGVTVAVIDTGLSLSDEFEDNLWTNETELNGEIGFDDDQNGYVDDIHGMSLTNDLSITDTNGHGTMMSGIIVMGRENGGGVGVAYGAKIMPVRISKTRNFGIDDLIEGINYAVDNGADIINMSVGTVYPTNDLQAAIQRASEKCLLIAAAGNEKRYASGGIYQSGVYPAAYPEVIGVMSTDNDGNMSDFTNWCSQEEAIYNLAAPGENILSTHLKGRYKASSGTSQAAAEVAAAAAVMRSLFPKKGVADLRQMLIDCMEHRTVYDGAHGGEHRWLYLPDIWKAYESLSVENETEQTEYPVTYPEPIAEISTTAPTETQIEARKVSVKRENPIRVTVKTKTIKAKKLKRKNQTVKPLNISKAQGKVTASIIGNGTNKAIPKLVKITSKGVITFKRWKKVRTGTYIIKVKITAKGNKNFKSKTLIKTVKIKVI